MSISLIVALIFIGLGILGLIQDKPTTTTNNEFTAKNFASGNQNIKLISPGRNRIGVLKEIREITGYGLKEAKDLIDSAPSLICKNIDDNSALIIKQKLNDLGATVNIEANNIDIPDNGTNK